MEISVIIENKLVLEKKITKRGVLKTTVAATVAIVLLAAAVECKSFVSPKEITETPIREAVDLFLDMPFGEVVSIYLGMIRESFVNLLPM